MDELPVRELSRAEMLDAVRIRESLGLRADEYWIRQVVADPNSSEGVIAYGIHLAPEELRELNQRASFSFDSLKKMVNAYGEQFPADWAGDFIDQQRDGILVAQFSANFEQHRAELMSRVRPGTRLEVRRVDWSLLHLRREAETLRGTDAWFATIPAVLTAYGVDVSANRILVRVSTVAPDAPEIIAEHFGWEGKVLVVPDGDGALLVPRGSLRILARDSSGAPVKGLRCDPVPDLGTGPEGLGPLTDINGECMVDLPATGAWVHLIRGGGPTREVVASARAVILPAQVTDITIEVAQP